MDITKEVYAKIIRGVTGAAYDFERSRECAAEHLRAERLLDKKRTPVSRSSHQSDRRGSNPRSRPWQGRALPTTPLSHFLVAKVLPQRQDI